MIRASVVVPVYNPGTSLHRCVDSLLNQSLPAESLELIFVDDGSTDGSGAWLDDLAARHSHVQVIHEPNSGWAGRPRNVGMDAATGEFVQFVDQDDALGPEALERLTAYGAAHGADIVLGKVTSNFRRVPRNLYEANIPRCSIRDAPLIRTLTPHKMFRRSFLLETKLRFPEGRRRLEDQLFVVQAFFATDAVAILADYPCYFFLRRDDGEHSAKLDYNPADYYANLREVLDVVAANTEPGEFRDGLHEKFLNTMLRKISSAARRRNEERFAPFATEIKAVVEDYFSPQVVERPQILRRQLAAAMLAGDPQAVRRLNRREKQLVGEIHSFSATQSAPGRWELSASASLRFRDGSPVRLLPDGDDWSIDKRLRVPGINVRSDSTAELLANTTANLALRSPKTGVSWLGTSDLTADLVPGRRRDHYHLVVSGTVELDAGTFAAGSPLPPGAWKVALGIKALGTTRAVGIRKQRGVDVSRPRHRGTGGPQLRFRDDDRLVLVV